MARKLSLLLINESGSTMKHVLFTRRQFNAALIMCLMGLAGVCFGIFHYFSLQLNLVGKRSLEHQLAKQAEEVVLQRQQIQAFAEEINGLKMRLLALNQFEEKIRTIANIDAEGNPDGLFGVGGSVPDNLKTEMDPANDHRRLIRDMHQQMQMINEASIQQHGTFETILRRLEDQKNLLAHTPAIRPAKGRLSSSFGYRQSPFTNKREFHKGLDIANAIGSPITASADGTVTFFGRQGSFGRMLVIDHGFGMITRYAHLEKALVQPGDHIRRGDTIALMGNSGRSTGSHLHYEVRLNGLPVNPENYISD